MIGSGGVGTLGCCADARSSGADGTGVFIRSGKREEGIRGGYRAILEGMVAG